MVKEKEKRVRVMVLMPLSTIFQLYHDGQFIGGGVRDTADLPKVTDKHYHIMLYRVYLVNMVEEA